MAASRAPKSRAAAARLLVLGDRQVGKSAAIVRYTTGRFIQHYCSATHDWFYRHPLGPGAQRNQFTVVELLEQRHIESGNNYDDGHDGDGDDEDEGEDENKNHDQDQDQDQDRDRDREQEQEQEQRDNRSAACSLSSRVALDRQLDAQFYEQQQLFNKLHWAHAYVVMYALDDRHSFARAGGCLELIAREAGQQQVSGELAGKAPPACRKPVLLLANKRDLDWPARAGQELDQELDQELGPPVRLRARAQARPSRRRVSHSEGRRLALRHQCLFAEISVSEAARPLEQALGKLIDSIQANGAPPCERRASGSARLGPTPDEHRTLAAPQLIHWLPGAPATCEAAAAAACGGKRQISERQWSQQLACQSSHLQPICSSLVRTRAPLAAHSSSQTVASGGGGLALAARAKRLGEPDIRLPRPCGASRSSGSSSSATSAGSSPFGMQAAAACSSLVGPAPVQVAEVRSQEGPRPILARRLVAGPRASISSASSVSSAGGPASHLGHRYESLKCSFRKGALAIVGSRSLANWASSSSSSSKKEAAATATAAATNAASSSLSQRSSLGSIRIDEEAGPALIVASDSDSSSAGTTSGGSRVPWIGHKIYAASKQDATEVDAGSLPAACNDRQQQRQHLVGGRSAVSRFRRPLFKYGHRRKTVAFEQAAAAQPLEPAPEAERALASEFIASGYQMPLASGAISPGGRRTSLGAASGLSSPANPVANKQAHSLELEQGPTKDLRSHSTSGGSCDYDDDDDDECGARRELGAQVAPPVVGLNAAPLVRPVQSTPTHLAGSPSSCSSATPPPLPAGQAVKRSFCSALFSGGGKSNRMAGALVRSTTAAAAASQLAKVEPIRTIPLMGFCK